MDFETDGVVAKIRHQPDLSTIEWTLAILVRLSPTVTRQK